MRIAKNIFANIDLVTVSLYVLLIIFGWLNIYASQYNDDLNFTLDFTTRYGKQLFFILFSSLVAFIILLFTFVYILCSNNNFTDLSLNNWKCNIRSNILV